MRILSRYFHTLRHLRARQLWFQVWNRVRRPAIDTSVTPELGDIPVVRWQVPARRDPSLVGQTTFTFLGMEANLDDLGWNDPDTELLWRYNQHYFDDLTAYDAPSRSEWHRALMGRWLKENVPGCAPGWDPYPISLRLVNWSKWLLAGNRPLPDQIASMAVQGRLLSRSLEYHVLGNHLLANAKALVFIGALFSGAEADRWLDTGLRLLARELPEQVLADGGNFERSPMYHALCLEDLLDLINLAGSLPERIPTAATNQWRPIASGMRYWLEAMCHPDGEIAHFNDTAIGVAPAPSELARYAHVLAVGSSPASGAQLVGEGVIWLRDSGYFRVSTDRSVFICDVAPLGPDYLPAHGHADTLSFELSVGSQRVIVNGGTSRYGTGPERLAERGTQAHSTVTVARLDSSEVWGGFRVARRARPFDISVCVGKGDGMIAASHDGYKRLAGSPIHRRTWRWSERSLEICDDVSPALPATAQYVAHPDLAVFSSDARTFQLGPVRAVVAEGDATVRPAFHSSGFGQKRNTQALCVALKDGQSRVQLCW